MSPSDRAKVDYVFIFHTPSHKDMRKIYEQWGSMCGSFEEFLHVYYSCTAGYGCLVVDNKSESKKISNLVYWYKVKIDGKFDENCKSREPGLLSHFLNEFYRSLRYL